jgi:phage host-nuclease inhibitor protein Gam
MKIPKTTAELEELMEQARKLRIELRAATLAREREHQDVDARWQPDIENIEAQIEVITQTFQAWAEANPAAFAARRSIELQNGVFGWRTGKPALKLLRGWDWERVLEVLRSYDPRFIRLKEEVDRERILSERDAIGPDLPKLGLKVVQKETFYVDPKIEEEKDDASRVESIQKIQ